MYMISLAQYNLTVLKLQALEAMEELFHVKGKCPHCRVTTAVWSYVIGIHAAPFVT